MRGDIFPSWVELYPYGMIFALSLQGAPFFKILSIRVLANVCSYAGQSLLVYRPNSELTIIASSDASRPIRGKP